MQKAYRIAIQPMGNLPANQAKSNLKKSVGYRKVTRGCATKPRCAVVAGGPSVKKQLNKLRKYDGDIYAVNDTAGFLSDNGIPCYLYSIDGTKIPYAIGPLVKGAFLATRCNPVQFKPFKKKDIRVFEMREDNVKRGIEGGPTGVCRAPHLFIAMGHMGIDFYGIEGSFFSQSHVGSDRQDARANMIVIRAGGIDYLTNAAFMLQNEFMMQLFKKYPTIYKNHSGGLLRAMMKHQKTWGVVAITKGLKEQFTKQKVKGWDKPYKFNEVPLCQK